MKVSRTRHEVGESWLAEIRQTAWWRSSKRGCSLAQRDIVRDIKDVHQEARDFESEMQTAAALREEDPRAPERVSFMSL